MDGSAGKLTNTYALTPLFQGPSRCTLPYVNIKPQMYRPGPQSPVPKFPPHTSASIHSSFSLNDFNPQQPPLPTSKGPKLPPAPIAGANGEMYETKRSRLNYLLLANTQCLPNTV